MLTSPIFWLMCLGVVIANGLVFIHRARKNCPAGEPDGSAEILRAFTRWILPLFVLVLIGSATGLSGVFRELPPRDPATLFDFLCFAFLLASFIRGTFWLFRDGGAEFVAERRLLRTITNSETEVKIWWIFLIVGATAGWVAALFGFAR